MKKILTGILVVIMVSGLFVYAAETTSDILDSATISKPTHHRILIDEKFNSLTKCTNMSALTTENGNHIAKVAPGVIAEYSKSSLWLENCTIQANIKLEYAGADWSEIMNIGYKNDSTKGKIMAYQAADKSVSRIYFQTAGQTGSQLWFSKDIPAEHKIFTGGWVKLRVDLNGENVDISLDDELLIEATGYKLANAWLGFKPGSATTLYIDNLLITRKLADIPSVEKDASRYTVLYQDFENLSQGTQDEIAAIGYNEIDSYGGSIETGFGETGKAFNFVGSYYMTGLNLGDTYTIEMNLKLDARNTDGAFGNSWPEFKFNRSWTDGESGYKMYFNTGVASTATPTGTLPSLEKTDKTYPARESISGKEMDLYNYAGEWTYLKIEKVPGEVRLYWNDKENYSYKWTEISDSITGGGIRINSSTATAMVIDNLYISTPNFPNETFAVDAKISQNSESSGATVKMTLTNFTDTAIQAGNAIVSAYSEGGLVWAGITEIGTLPANPKDGTSVTIEKTMNVEVEQPENCTYKVFFWNMPDMTPVREAIDISTI